MSNYSRLIEIFEKLVSFKTVVGNTESMAACMDYCESILKPAGLHINRYSSNGVPSMVATSRATKKPKILLQAHLDVVPGADDMFHINGEGKTLVGRGAIDMKFAAACFLYLVEDIGGHGDDFDFGIMFTMDEESDGLNGVEYLLDQGFGCDICFLPDGGDNWKVESTSKGLWRAELEAYGRSAHASRPWLGDNPIPRLLAVITEAQKLTSEDPVRGSTVVPTIFESGTGDNQIPEYAKGVIDVRFARTEEYSRIFERLDVLGKKYKVRIHTGLLSEVLIHETTQPAFIEWQRIVKEVRGRRPGYMQSIAASDARHFMRRGITTLVTRPAGGGLHGPDEWVDEAGLYEFYECLKMYLEKMASRPAVIA